MPMDDDLKHIIKKIFVLHEDPEEAMTAYDVAKAYQTVIRKDAPKWPS